MYIDELKTPALLIEQPVLNANIERMAGYCREHQVNLRVDVSSHRVPMIAYKQIAAGACGITCQTLTEVEDFIDAGCYDILIPTSALRVGELDRLLRRSEQLLVYVATNSQITSEEISRVSKQVKRRTPMLIEIDGNGKWSYLCSPFDTLKIAEGIIALPNVDFAGLMTSLTSHTRSSHLLETLSQFEAAGIPVPIVSGGSARYAFQTHEVPQMTELCAGAYVLYDLAHVCWNVCTPTDCALTILTSVVSTPSENLVILDAGAQTLTKTHLAAIDSLPAPSPSLGGGGLGERFGVIKDHPNAILSSLAWEYGHLNTEKSSHQFTVGEKVRLIPVDSKATIGVNKTFAFIRDNRVLEILPILPDGESQ